MKAEDTELEGVIIITPSVFADSRGSFLETYQRNRYIDVGIDTDFVQDNLSFSVKGTLRGLHYQLPPHAQAKLVQVIQGEVFDVAVDIRQNSPTFGCWVGVTLSGENKRQLFIPKGFAHGFCVLSQTAVFSYKCDDFYAPECERGIFWSDSQLGINWPISDPVLSDKDSKYVCLEEIVTDELPKFEE